MYLQTELPDTRRGRAPVAQERINRSAATYAPPRDEPDEDPFPVGNDRSHRVSTAADQVVANIDKVLEGTS
jgi:hypothetical protein